MKRKGKKRKVIITSSIVGTIVLLLVGAYGFDYAVSKRYEFELIARSDDVIIADGVSSIRFRVKLTKDNKPVAGHTIYFYASNGSLPVSRIITNESGWITFTYYPYLFVNEKVTPLDDVTIYFQDESNSYIFLVPATWKFTMPVVKPDGVSGGSDWEDL